MIQNVVGLGLRRSKGSRGNVNSILSAVPWPLRLNVMTANTSQSVWLKLSVRWSRGGTFSFSPITWGSLRVETQNRSEKQHFCQLISPQDCSGWTVRGNVQKDKKTNIWNFIPSLNYDGPVEDGEVWTGYLAPPAGEHHVQQSDFTREIFDLLLPYMYLTALVTLQIKVFTQKHVKII